jgi:hypothetical protein
MSAHKGGSSTIPAALCTCVFLICPCVLGLQALEWIGTGQWPSLPTSVVVAWTGLDYPELNLFGLQKMVDWLLDVPLSLAAAPFGLLALMLRPA